MTSATVRAIAGVSPGDRVQRIVRDPPIGRVPASGRATQRAGRPAIRAENGDRSRRADRAPMCAPPLKGRGAPDAAVFAIVPELARGPVLRTVRVSAGAGGQRAARARWKARALAGVRAQAIAHARPIARDSARVRLKDLGRASETAHAFADGRAKDSLELKIARDPANARGKEVAHAAEIANGSAAAGALVRAPGHAPGSAIVLDAAGEIRTQEARVLRARRGAMRGQ